MKRLLYATAAVVIAAAPVSAHGETSYPQGGGTYTVKAGDTLGQIARTHLGSASRWREIAEMNGIHDARRLRIGTVLRLPGGGTMQTGGSNLVGPGAPMRDRAWRAEQTHEPIATAPSTQREPGDRARLLPAHPTHPGIEEGATSYPSEQEPIGEAAGGTRRHIRQHEHTLLPANRSASGPAAPGAAPTSYPAKEQEPLASDPSTRRRPEPSGGRLTTGRTDRGANQR